ncbi:receptor-like protein EIX1 [Camellia sinensis]|uniref:receptor-like protein EIX1 n=1 Tax=Camellia sinensis TaxID=4442 RepID=UPI001035961A|nr:receptor-like protein EIX1 [Camellia sinensis]
MAVVETVRVAWRWGGEAEIEGSVVEMKDLGFCNIGCNNSTSHVTTHDLRSQHRTVISQGEFLSASLLDLPYLSYLDLSQTDFRQIQIPESIGSIVSLEHVDLPNANFRGTIPDHLGNLSRLQSLDLSGNSNSLQTNNLNWLRGLSSLLVLDLGGVDLSNVADWLDAINMLPSLVELTLFTCKLQILQPTLPYVKFTKLELVDLSLNSFNSTMPSWLFSISHSLVSLNLSRSQSQGLIPNTFENT